MHVVLAGGIGAARFLRGLVALLPSSEVMAIVNVGDDITMHGLRICPDLDSITYWLGGVVHPEQEWGRADERHVVAEELARFGRDTWFTLGDRDLATHLHRTARLHDGLTLTQVTDEIRRAFGVSVQLLPVTDDPIETRIITTDGRDLHFQEYWVRDRAGPEVSEIRVRGAESARAAAGVEDALLSAEVVLIAPSNPVVSIDPILAIPGIVDTLRRTTAPIVGISPIVEGEVVRGMADRLLRAVGAEVSAAGVAAHYGDLLDGWVIDQRDADQVDRIRSSGPACVSTDTMMDDPAIARGLAESCLRLASVIKK